MTYIEQCLYDYRANKVAIEVLSFKKDSLMSVSAASYEPLNNRGNVLDPVSDIANQVIHLEEKISQIERAIAFVDRLKAGLNGSSFAFQQMRNILQMKYIDHESSEYIQDKLAISKSTLWRRNVELLRIAKKYFGE